jgi:SHS2 domain-containing protein
MGEFRFVEHTADVAIEVSAETLPELFRVAGIALREIVYGQVSVRNREQKIVELEADTLEELLVDFLNELNYYLLVRQWIYRELKVVELKDYPEQKYVKAILLGEPVQPERHEVQVEIKAATFHQLEIRREAGKYRTMIVFDT